MEHIDGLALICSTGIRAAFRTDTWRNDDAMITSSLRRNDVGDVVWT